MVRTNLDKISSSRGERPTNRPRPWGEDEKQKKKELQSKVWFQGGGFDVPLLFPTPHTPKGELAKRIREAEDATKSVLEMHAVHHHDGRADVNFSGSYTNFLDRQITGRVNNMENLKGPAIMNRRNEMVGNRVERTQYRRLGDGQ